MFDTNDAIKLTIGVIITGILLVSLYDIWVYMNYGSDATISRILLKAAQKAPIIGIAFGIAIGTLLGHLFWPQRIKENKELTPDNKDDIV